MTKKFSKRILVLHLEIECDTNYKTTLFHGLLVSLIEALHLFMKGRYRATKMSASIVGKIGDKNYLKKNYENPDRQ